ncbi:MAG: hypothetical protein AB7S38_28720 [Vulcanimicrobiota bacterium]
MSQQQHSHALARSQKAVVNQEDPFAGLDASQCNLIHPVQASKRTSPFHVARLSIVKASTKESDGDYYTSSFTKPGEGALTKQFLMRLANAAGINWNGRESGPVPSGDPDIVIYKAVGWYIGADGQRVSIVGTKEIDTRDNGAEVKRLQASGKKKDWEIQKELASIRQHRMALAETKAKLRAIREVLNIKSKYNIRDLEKPFVIPHIDFNPDLTDPAVRQLTAAGGMQAIQNLFGPPQDEPAGYLPAANEPQDFDPDTGEVYEAEHVPEPASASEPTVDLSAEKRAILDLAREAESSGEPLDGPALVAAMQQRMTEWAQAQGRGICGWSGNLPSLGASNAAQLGVLRANYEKLLNEKKLAAEVDF